MDSHDIPCEVFDHNVGSYLPSNLTGGIRVMVLEKDLQQALESGGMKVNLIGGADVASELDAKRAIRQAAELAMVI